jgi:hypothetical protein
MKSSLWLTLISLNLSELFHSDSSSNGKKQNWSKKSYFNETLKSVEHRARNEKVAKILIRVIILSGNLIFFYKHTHKHPLKKNFFSFGFFPFCLFEKNIKGFFSLEVEEKFFTLVDVCESGFK